MLTAFGVYATLPCLVVALSARQWRAMRSPDVHRPFLSEPSRPMSGMLVLVQVLVPSALADGLTVWTVET